MILRSQIEIEQEIDRLELRLTSMGTRLQWEMLTPLLNTLYAELETVQSQSKVE